MTMAVTRATYREDGMIELIMDGITYTVPDDMDNRDRRKLQAWVDKGNVIDPYVPPGPTPEETRRDEFRGQPDYVDLAAKLKTSTPGQIDTWLTNNVTNLTQARSVLGAIIKYLAAMV
jgi:hypothetical protein